MKKTLVLISSFLFAGAAMAQLPADPWQTQAKTPRAVAIVPAPVAGPQTAGSFQGGSSNPNNIPLPKFIGENTTWTKAQGQREIAPEVNITNMLLMTDYLRQAGYQIPTGLDQLITTAPARLRTQIMDSLQFMQSSSHPVSVAATDFSHIFESRTGFSITNLIQNSIRIIDERR